MEQRGYIYVLANSAMPGLVKVGKTTRSSSDRARELSSATGLPTPFIVVYEQLFLDCGAAELFVHAHLERNGYRVMDNREFFNAPVNTVVKAIAMAPGAIDAETVLATLADQGDSLFTRDKSESDKLTLNGSTFAQVWLPVFLEAEKYYFGTDECLQDFAEAMRLFRQAARLGSLSAYGYIGTMIEEGEGVPQDSSKALEAYKEGARKGSAYCYWRMAMQNAYSIWRRKMSKDYDSHYADAKKCFSFFLHNLPTKFPDIQRLDGAQLSVVQMECVLLIMHDSDKELVGLLGKLIVGRLNEIRETAHSFVDLARSRGDSRDEMDFLAVIEYLNTIAIANTGARQTIA